MHRNNVYGTEGMCIPTWEGLGNISHSRGRLLVSSQPFSMLTWNASSMMAILVIIRRGSTLDWAFDSKWVQALWLESTQANQFVARKNGEGSPSWCDANCKSCGSTMVSSKPKFLTTHWLSKIMVVLSTGISGYTECAHSSQQPLRYHCPTNMPTTHGDHSWHRSYTSV